MKKTLSILALTLCAALSGCGKDDVRPWVVEITDVQNIPSGTTFDRITVELVGADWQTVTTVEAPWDGHRAVLRLPDMFVVEQLQRVDRGPNGRAMEGYWPSVASDPAAGVVSTRDEFTAWSADRRVGRLYLTDWSGQGTTVDKMYLGFQWADRPFTLNGFTGKVGFLFNGTAFVAGWNTYAKLNTSTESISVITDIPEDRKAQWRFEAWP